MDKIATAVLHCSLNDPKKVIAVAKKIVAKMYVNTTEYATPPITLLVFQAQVNKADQAQAAVDDGSVLDTITRDTEVKKLFTMLNPTLINYVNTLYKGDAENLGLSGFDVVTESHPHSIPPQLVIKKIVDGPTEHSAKIFLESMHGPLEEKPERVTFILQTSDDMKEENFHTILTTSNSHKLLIENLTRGKEQFIRVAASNGHGTAKFSDPVGFIPQ